MSIDGNFIYGDNLYISDEHMNEEWESVGGTGYFISNHGRVWSAHTHQFLKPKPMDREGHLGVCLSIDGRPKYVYIHRLMAEYFIPNPYHYPVVRHLDDDRENNTLENLAWGTQRDNIHDAIRNGKTHYVTDEEREKALCKMRRPVIATHLRTGEKRRFSSQTEAARILGAQQANIHKVLSGQREQTVGYSFEYEEG